MAEGSSGAMIKLTFCLHRRPEMTREAFQDYWFNVHAPLVASVREVLRIRRYVQLHSLPPKVSEQIRATRGGPTDYDGVAQLWWDSLADMALARAEDAGAAALMLLEDERKFIDLARSPLWWGEEKVIF